jgi:hypothetical protein
MLIKIVAPIFLLSRIQVFFAEMAAWLESHGSSAAVFLDQLYEKWVLEPPSSSNVLTQGQPVRYGYFETSNSYFLCSEPALIDRIFDRLRRWTLGTVRFLDLSGLVVDS